MLASTRTEPIGARMRQLRLDRNLTQSDLAELADISLTHMFRIELKNVQPGLFTAIEIAKALGVSLDYLAGLSNDPRPAQRDTPKDI